MLQEWYTPGISGFGKKVKIERGTVNRCVSDLIKRKKFTEKDIVYAKAAKKIKEREIRFRSLMDGISRMQIPASNNWVSKDSILIARLIS